MKAINGYFSLDLIYFKAFDRDNQECSICMMDFPKMVVLVILLKNYFAKMYLIYGFSTY